MQWITSLPDLVPGRTPIAVPMVSNVAQYGAATGTIMLNLAVVTIVPSWINLKAKDVNAQQSVWFSMGLTTLTYTIVGLFCKLLGLLSSTNSP